MKRITVLGSTGSIGTQALDIVRSNPDKFTISALTCGSNVELLRNQIIEFRPELCVTEKEDAAKELRASLDAEICPKISWGEEGLIEAAAYPTDIVLNSLMGMRGLLPTLSAIEAKHDIALANKETLVAGGSIVMKAAKENGVKILPVDSEHSAIFQCLEGNKGREIRRILLTASGGPFRGWNEDELEKVTPEMALKHPNWSMGKKITIDSATMMNKGLEIIEAMHLFDVPVSKIQVLVHPQSIVHSGVEFMDTAILAELGTPDMRVPISVALHYPDRLKLETEVVDFFGKARELTFEEPNPETFKCLSLAIRAAQEGGTLPGVMNGANEVLVDLFLNKKIGFTDIPRIIMQVMDEHQSDGCECPFVGDPTLPQILESDRWARRRAEELALG